MPRTQSIPPPCTPSCAGDSRRGMTSEVIDGTRRTSDPSCRRHIESICQGGSDVIELRMARLAPIQAHIGLSASGQDSTALAFRYLYLFRRIVVGLALAGASVAFLEQWTGLCAAFVCIGIGEMLESSYYIGMLRWRERHNSPQPTPLTARPESARR